MDLCDKPIDPEALSKTFEWILRIKEKMLKGNFLKSFHDLVTLIKNSILFIIIRHTYPIKDIVSYFDNKFGRDGQCTHFFTDDYFRIHFQGYNIEYLVVGLEFPFPKNRVVEA